MTIKYQGSSPRVRGSRICKLFFRAAQGIIPAGAGLTARSDSQTRQEGIIPAGAGLTRGRLVQDSRWWDHPRGCGAHSPPHFFTVTIRGSSPRVRGSRSTSHTITYSNGIIPAGAGLTMHDNAFAVLLRDHPRGCGAHTKKSQQLRHFPVLWLPESFTFKHSYRILHLVYSFVSAAT